MFNVDLLKYQPIFVVYVSRFVLNTTLFHLLFGTCDLFTTTSMYDYCPKLSAYYNNTYLQRVRICTQHYSLHNTMNVEFAV